MFTTNKKVKNEEALERLINNSAKKILEDVLIIRRRGDYEPDYNKPKLYQNYDLCYKDTEEVVKKGSTVTCERPKDCPIGLHTWLRYIHNAHRKEVLLKTLSKEKEKYRSEFFQTIAADYIMKKMLKIN